MYVGNKAIPIYNIIKLSINIFFPLITDNHPSKEFKLPGKDKIPDMVERTPKNQMIFFLLFMYHHL